MRHILLNTIGLTMLALFLACMFSIINTLQNMTTSLEEGLQNQEIWLEPYGGCDEAALYPRSDGYRECVKHGRLP